MTSHTAATHRAIIADRLGARTISIETLRQGTDGPPVPGQSQSISTDRRPQVRV